MTKGGQAVPTWLIVAFNLISEAWSVRRDARVRLLMAQIEILRHKLPGNRVIVSPEDRARLIRLGEALGHDVDGVIGIVSPKTYRQWLRDQKSGKVAKPVGRPRKITPSVRELILRLARENHGWGIRRIVGELRKLALSPSRSSVRRVLVDEEGLLPDPHRHAPKGVTTPWRTFIKMHMETMVASDFFCKQIWTPIGKRAAYCLMFIHLGSRKVFVSPSTLHPTDAWVKQQGRNLSLWLDEEGLAMEYFVHDRDTKFTRSFDRNMADAGIQIVKTPYVSPIANCYAESWIGTLKRECLNHFFCISLSQLDRIVQAYVSYYNQHRPHQSLGNVPLGMRKYPIPIRMAESPADSEEIGTVQRYARLGGLLNHYERKAA